MRRDETDVELPRFVLLSELLLGDELDGRLEERSDVGRGLEAESSVGAELQEAELVEELLAVERMGRNVGQQSRVEGHGGRRCLRDGSVIDEVELSAMLDGGE